MAYVRWGEVVNSTLKETECLQLYEQGLSFGDVKKEKLKTPESYCSDWYIFWSASGDDDDTRRDNQYLAMWLAGETYLPTLDYPSVRYMYEHDDWTMLGYSDIPQRSLLVRCVRDWLENVERECTP